MNDSQLRQIIRQEIASSSSRGRFKLGTTPFHAHTGLDSPKINQNNVQAGLRVEGSITFAQATTYKILTNFSPTAVWIHGNVTGASGEKFIVVGNAQLGGNPFYMQPGTSTSTTVGGPPQSIIQSSTYFGGTSGVGGALHTVVDEGHIVDVEYPLGTIFARATITGFDNQAIYITVNNLTTGWTINLSLTIT